MFYLKLNCLSYKIIILLDRNGANSVLMIADHLNETLSKVESLIDSDFYSGSLDDIYDVIETFSIYRPVRYYIFF